MGIYSIKRFGLTSSRGRDRVGVGIRSSYIRVLGIQVDTDGSGEFGSGGDSWLGPSNLVVLSTCILGRPCYPPGSLSCHPSPPGRSFTGAVTPQEEEEFRRLAALPNVYEVVSKSIAPSIFGGMDMKKAIACLLFGGSRKRLVLFPCSTPYSNYHLPHLFLLHGQSPTVPWAEEGLCRQCLLSAPYLWDALGPEALPLEVG